MENKQELTVEEKVEQLKAALPLIQDIRKTIEAARARKDSIKDIMECNMEKVNELDDSKRELTIEEKVEILKEAIKLGEKMMASLEQVAERMKNNETK